MAQKTSVKWSRLGGVLILLLLLSFNSVSHADSLGRSLADSVITMEVKLQLIADVNTKGLSINVTTEQGVVKLSGVVPSQQGAAMAVLLAAATEGVTDVDTTDLFIQNTSMPLKDAFLTAKVKGNLIKTKTLHDRELPVSKIHIVSRDEIVYVTGEVKSQQQVDEVSISVAKVAGVKKVVNKLLVTKN